MTSPEKTPAAERRCFRVSDVSASSIKEVQLEEIRSGDLFVLLDPPDGNQHEDGTRVNRALGDAFLDAQSIAAISCEEIGRLPRPIVA